MQFCREDIFMLLKLYRSEKEKHVYSETEQKNVFTLGFRNAIRV